MTFTRSFLLVSNNEEAEYSSNRDGDENGVQCTTVRNPLRAGFLNIALSRDTNVTCHAIYNPRSPDARVSVGNSTKIR